MKERLVARQQVASTGHDVGDRRELLLGRIAARHQSAGDIEGLSLAVDQRGLHHVAARGLVAQIEEAYPIGLALGGKDDIAFRVGAGLELERGVASFGALHLHWHAEVLVRFVDQCFSFRRDANEVVRTARCNLAGVGTRPSLEDIQAKLILLDAAIVLVAPVLVRAPDAYAHPIGALLPDRYPDIPGKLHGQGHITVPAHLQLLPTKQERLAVKAIAHVPRDAVHARPPPELTRREIRQPIDLSEALAVAELVIEGAFVGRQTADGKAGEVEPGALCPRAGVVLTRLNQQTQPGEGPPRLSIWFGRSDVAANVRTETGLCLCGKRLPCFGRDEAREALDGAPRRNT